MTVEDFIARWRMRCAGGGSERSNAQMFLCELCEVLGVAAPHPSGARADDDYVFEYQLRGNQPWGDSINRRIDLYKRGRFVLEAKQSREPGQAKAIPAYTTTGQDPWDVPMRNAVQQALRYVQMLPASHPAPPFIIACDVGAVIELYADFSGSGRAYAPFPDRNSHRIRLEDLRRPEIILRLRAVWTDPCTLDPSRIAARVTRDIVNDLAAISRDLEDKGHSPQDVAHFLMRCIFTLFAASVDLLPRDRLRELFDDGVASPRAFTPQLSALWRRLDDPSYDSRYHPPFGVHLPHINGGLFRDAQVLLLDAEQIGILRRAIDSDWRNVEPAIFGALLEAALDPHERRRLGAHYTPRAYVEQVVEPTVMAPLRAEWSDVVLKAERERENGDAAAAVRTVTAFQRRLTRLRILDPACGAGNFLAVALDLLKGLEAKVLDMLVQLGQSDLLDLDGVQPSQFLGMEINPRAAAIADLVLWIGFLQRHYRNHRGHPAEPILRAFNNITVGDAVLERDPSGAVRPTVWPAADFIIGNPPFIGGKDLRGRLGAAYAEDLWRAYPDMNPSADYVMYWWRQAATALCRPGSPLIRFGFVTTNSITQPFRRRTIETWLSGPSRLSLVQATPDHPWTQAAPDAAAVRIAMTVAQAGDHDGDLLTVESESGLDTDLPRIVLRRRSGRINADLTIGTDLTRAHPLRANAGLCSPGVKPHGGGFILTREQAVALGLGRPGRERLLRPYRNGRDLTARSRDAFIIDLHDLDVETVRRDHPDLYQHVVEQVKEVRDKDGRPVGRDVNPRATYRDNWWVFGEPRRDFRPALEGLSRYIVTVETAKHRLFQFLPAATLADNMLVCIADDDAATLAILSSRTHRLWAMACGGRLESRPRYTKSLCFDPFPFPVLSDAARLRLRLLGEELSFQRRRILDARPDLTLTDLYNLMGSSRPDEVEAWNDDGRARPRPFMALRDLHDAIDRDVEAAYGWAPAVEDAAVLAALAALNAERAREEANGRVRWLRPAFQSARSASRQLRPRHADPLLPTPAPVAYRPRFPREQREQPLAVMAVLRRAEAPLHPRDLARRFARGGARTEARAADLLATLHRYGHVSRLPDGRYAADG